MNNRILLTELQEIMEKHGFAVVDGLMPRA